MPDSSVPRRPRFDHIVGSQFAPILLGIGALALGTAAGLQPGILDAVVRPPALLRAACVGGAVVAGLALLRAALLRLESSRGDVPALARGIRFVFLSVAAFAAGGGWVAGNPLPIVVAFVIAGIDVIETSFLLLIAAQRGVTASPGGPRERDGTTLS